MDTLTERGYQEDRHWADRFHRAIEEVVRLAFPSLMEFSISSPEADMKSATDYLVTIKTGTIACRVRHAGYFESFGDLTIRAYRGSGATTELEKIKMGGPRWYLYAWESGATVGAFEAWVVVDMDESRKKGVFHKPRNIIYNKERKTGFVAIPLLELCIVASYGN